MRTPEDLASRPAHRGARLATLRLLNAAKKAAPRLDDPKDSEALHDFRVSLRRLRSVLRFYRKVLNPRFPKKLIKRIKDLASATGGGRDAEVMAGYLREWKAGAWLREGLEARAREAYAKSVESAKRGFLGLEPSLREALPLRRGAPVSGGRDVSFGKEMGSLMLEAAARLSRDLTTIRSAHDVKRGHRARISGKRLRYLMEPLRRRSAAWKRCVADLKKLQDILGELHDMHVLEDEVIRTTEELALEGVRLKLAKTLGEAPPPAAGPPHGPGTVQELIRAARLVRRRENLLFKKLTRTWSEVRRARFFGEAAALAQSLRAIEVPAPPVIAPTPPRRPCDPNRLPTVSRTARLPAGGHRSVKVQKRR